ncbi:MAG: YbaK/EbsC family protein, partial [Ghiorsea sp.]|nr:YbaK/EbsC family protein [Ghiorsea sp.]
IYKGIDAQLGEVETPKKTAVEDVAAFLSVKPSTLLKTLIYVAVGGDSDGQIVAACVRGTDNVQEIKLARAIAADEVSLASKEQLESVGTVTGYAGPTNLSCPIYIDASLTDEVGLIAGANKYNYHISGLNIERDLNSATFADLRETQVGDTCGKCGKGSMEMSRGIEVGHIFELGTVYAKPMEVLFQNEQGKRDVATMGCYGIGVSRLMAAVVEQCNDNYGIMWPVNLAPFKISVITLGKSETALAASENIYNELLKQGVDVVWDDRKESPGVKFKDAELTGIPLRIVVGDRGLDNNALEIKTRWGDKTEAAPADVCAQALSILEQLKQETN